MVFLTRILVLTCVILYVCMSTSCDAASISNDISSCNGAFDVYFVLDLSSSLISGRKNHFREETVSFVKELVDKFTNPLLRLSFITFNNEANVVMPLTNDRTEVESRLEELRHAKPDGVTKLGLGLEKVNTQINAYGKKRASVAILLTDGIVHYTTKVKAVNEANKARQMGSTIMAVGVGDFDTSQLLEIVGCSKQLIFKAESFHGLQGIVEKVIDESCIEIVSAAPDVICANSSFELSVNGKGFDKAANSSQVKCHYYIDKATSFMVTPSSFAPNRLTCPSPDNVNFAPEDEVVLQVTLNGGISFISSNVTIKAFDCVSSTGVLWATLFFFAALILALIWWFWNVLCCVVVVNPKQKPSRPMPPPPPRPPSRVVEVQQWPTVDASFYGGRGAGGINPMKVSWGDKGCTEAAMHLEKTKDAKEVGFVAKEVLVEYEPVKKLPVTTPITCCGGLKCFQMRLFSPFMSLYGCLSIRRPSTNDMKKCVLIRPQIDVSDTKRNSGASLTGGYLDTSN